MNFYNAIFKSYKYQRYKKLDYFVAHSEGVQEKEFEFLIKKGIDTYFGKKYGFNSIKDYTSYSTTVPIIHYEDLETFIERMRMGEENILWPGKIKWLAKSSGTTNDKSKFIPITIESLYKCHYKGSTDVLLFYLINNRKSKLFTGKTITLGGSHNVDKYKNGIKSGDLSAIMLENCPFIANLYRTPPKKIALLSDWNQKLSAITKVAINQNITGFAGVPSWNLVLMNHILAYTGKQNLLEIWPNLELFMHGGICFSPYKEQYQKIIPTDNMHYMETYNASEGFFAIQNDLLDSSMMLMPDYGIFYEFITLDDYQRGDYKAVPLSGVKANINYVLVITTNGGLWRYVIGDTVMFTSVNPFKIKITGRTKCFINAFGEELVMDNADKAIFNACKATGAILTDYTAAPIYMTEKSKGQHEWLIEFEKEPESLDVFIDILDSTLKSLNSDYEAKRYNDTTMIKPLVRVLPKGTFYKWFQEKGRLGGQNKVPRLSNDRKIIDELNAFLLN